ncbi:MAG: hypothetical protein R3251_02725, partial [Candidatus Spechtbacterales bacterium]|nr:hypothetical protein [Candidatus Spechtbacterales bacterium]
MPKLSLKPNFFKYLFRKKYEYFYILDFGRSSIKLAILEINKADKQAKILEVHDEPHAHHIGAAEGVEHVEQVAVTIGKVMEKLKNAKNNRAKDVVIGLASEMVYGHSFSYIHKRENSGAKIDLRELKNAIHNAELKAYEDIRKKFVTDSGYSETDVALINSYIQEMRIDGYRVANPLGFEGGELFISVFNAYLPSFYKKMFEDTAEH